MPEISLNAVTHRSRWGWRFWVVTIAALCTVAVTISLGRWQLSRAEQKEALAARIAAQQAHPPLAWSALQAVEDIDTEMHRRVQLRGLWLPTQTVYLDNRQMHGRPGFYVLTPFALEGEEVTLMVQRGWIPRNFLERTQLPEVDTPSGLVDIEARVSPPPARLLQLGKEALMSAPATPSPESEGAQDAAPQTQATVSDAAEPSRASRIRQNLDLSAFRAETGLPLRTDFSLQQIGPSSEGLDRDWPAPALGVEKHHGYAFQWFGLATLVTLLYVWFQFIAPRRRRG